MSNLNERIFLARKKKGLSQKAVADHFDISRVSVTNWESGRTSPDREKLPALAELLDTTVEWLLEGRNSVVKSMLASLPSNATIINETLKGSSVVPLYGATVGGEDGEFKLDDNYLSDVFAPQSLSAIPGAYAVRVVGDSMHPRYEDNETVFVNPKRKPVRGDYVVAQIQKDEQGEKLAYVKRLVRYTQAELVLEQFNPEKELRFDGSSVLSLHYILRSGE